MSYRGTGRLLLEGVGAVAAIGVIALLVLFWRLTSAPVPVDFLAPQIERAFAGEGIKVTVGSTALIWDGNNREIQVEARDWRFRDSENRPLAYLPRAELTLSLDALLQGTFGATKVELDRARLRLLRDEEGRFSFAGAFEESEGAPDLSTLAEDVLVQLLAPANPDRPLSYLQQIDIRNARVLFDDRRVERQVEVRDASLLIWRAEEGLRGRIEGFAALGEAAAGLDASLWYDPERRTIESRIDFSDLHVADLAPWAGFQEIEGVALTLEGEALVELPLDGRLPAGTFSLYSRQGWLDLPEIFAQPFEVRSLAIEGAFDVAGQALRFSEMELHLGNEMDPGPRVKAVMAVARRQGAVDLAVEAQVSEVLISDLHAYWPVAARDGGRPWVVGNIPAGRAPEGRIKAHLTIAETAGSEPEIHELDGAFSFEDLEVHYLRPLPPASGLSGSATFDADGFYFEVEEGGLDELEITGGKVAILGLQENQQYLEVDFNARSPLPLILKVLEHPRLNLLQELGFTARGSGGATRARARFRLPLEEEVTLEDIEIAVEAELEEVLLPAAVLGQDLTGGPLSLQLSQDAMEIEGEALLGDVPLQKVSWKEVFSGGPGSTRVSATVPRLDEEARARLGIDLGPYLRGPLAGEVNLVSRGQNAATLDLSLDLQMTELQLQEIDWTKPPGRAGRLSGRVNLQNERPLLMEGFELQAEGLSLSQGKIEFDEQGDPRNMLFASAILDNSELQQLSIRRLEGGGLEVHIGGGRLDLEPLLKDDERQEEETLVEAAEDTAATLLVIAPHLSELRFSENRLLRTVELRVLREHGLWQEVVLRGEIPRHLWRYRGTYDAADEQTVRKAVSLEYGRAADRPGYALNLEADDLGALLRAIDLFDTLEGGDLQIVGTSPAPLPSSPMELEVWVDDYHLVEAPVLARLLTIASLSGLGNLLTGEGIAFQRLTGSVTWSEGRLSSDLLRAYGPSLGITARGHLDLEGETSEVRGTLVPAYSINRVLGAIPLLGFLLTGGEGEGVLGVTYVLSGSLEDPQFSVNPLSVLTPGFLRGLFNLPTGEGAVEPPSVFPPEELRGR